MPEQPLEIWAYTSCPGTRPVLEAAISLELPYVFWSAPHNGANRAEYKKRYFHYVPWYRQSLGMLVLPLLHDPNTGVTLVESINIVNYLREKYAHRAVVGKGKLEESGRRKAQRSEADG
jgi:hypothetical protein